MAKAFCLTKELADKLKALAIRGEINISKMYEMTSKERRALFEKWVDTKTAQKINAGFEEAMVSNQQTALKNWAKSVFGSKETKQKKDVLSKIERLSDLGVLTPKNSEEFLTDLVATKLGATVTAEEASQIAEKSKKLVELSGKTSEFGTPTLEYFKAKKEMEDYIESLAPSSRLKVATSIIGRGSMLLSFKSPILNIESNTIQAFLASAERRLISLQLGAVNGDYARDYIKFVNKVYNETGYDISRMRDLQETKKTRGEEVTTTQGKGKTRKVARLYEDIVFKKLMGAPDVAFSSVNFADSAHLASTKIAQGEKLKGEALKKRALEIFKDATKVSPATPEGRAVREQAIADAEYATYTNESQLSRVSGGIRHILNLASGDLKLGDQLMPFVKTPANVIQAGIDASGVLLPIQTLVRVSKVIQGIREGRSIKDSTMAGFEGYSRSLVRAGLGTTLAMIIASLFDPEDFIGEYPVSAKERELLELQNATTNSVKIGDKWVSLDYFGAIGTPLVAMLYAKKYGKDTLSSMYSYYLGAGRQIAKIPGLELGKDVFETLSKAKFEGIEGVKKDLTLGLVDFVRSRTVPAFVYDLAKATDKYERERRSGKPEDIVTSTIPGLRQGLPIRQTVLGEDIQAESPLSAILFGSRVKTVGKSPVIDELVRLSTTNNLPSITDYAKTSDRMKGLKSQIGDQKFLEAQKFLGTNLNRRFSTLMASYKYRRMTDEERAKELNKVKEETLELTLKRFNYRKPK